MHFDKSCDWWTLLAQHQAQLLSKCHLTLSASRDRVLISPSCFHLAFTQRYKGCSVFSPRVKLPLATALKLWAPFQTSTSGALSLTPARTSHGLALGHPDAGRPLWEVALIQCFHQSDFQESDNCSGVVHMRTSPTVPFHLGKKKKKICRCHKAIPFLSKTLRMWAITM